MKNFSRGSRFGGNNKGGFSKGGFHKGGFGGDRRSGPPSLHDATCAECGAACQVPFKPNGRKPVLCRACFGKEEGGEQQRFERPSFGDRRPSAAPAAPSRSAVDTGKIEARLKSIEEKLDALIDALTEDMEDEEGEGEETESKS